MSEEFTKPLPAPTPVSAPFWEGLKQEKVIIQQCGDCQAWGFYPRTHCRACLSSNLIWREVSGEGTLHTYTITRQPTAPHFSDEVPQFLAMVDLDEGVRLTTTLIHDDEASIKVGSRVVPVFDHINDQTTLLRYRLA